LPPVNAAALLPVCRATLAAPTNGAQRQRQQPAAADPVLHPRGTTLAGQRTPRALRLYTPSTYRGALFGVCLCCVLALMVVVQAGTRRAARRVKRGAAATTATTTTAATAATAATATKRRQQLQRQGVEWQQQVLLWRKVTCTLAAGTPAAAAAQKSLDLGWLAGWWPCGCWVLGSWPRSTACTQHGAAHVWRESRVHKYR